MDDSKQGLEGLLDGEYTVRLVFTYRTLNISIDADDIKSVDPAAFERACRDFVKVFIKKDSQ